MHGANPIRRQLLDEGHRLYVEELFHTLQGEGPFAGVPSVFIRLAGCWLKCHFCDTQFEDGMKREPVSVEALTEQVKALAGKTSPRLTTLVVLTGGDPLRQNIVPLVAWLTAAGFHVQIETAGVQWVPGLERFIGDDSQLMRPGRCSIVCSPKTGHVCDEMHRYAHAWKYIIRGDDLLDPLDGLPLSSTQLKGKTQRLARAGSASLVYIQPCDEGDADKNRTNALICARAALRYGYRVSIQTHKILQLP